MVTQTCSTGEERARLDPERFVHGPLDLRGAQRIHSERARTGLWTCKGVRLLLVAIFTVTSEQGQLWQDCEPGLTGTIDGNDRREDKP